jgi:hypothetical protein
MTVDLLQEQEVGRTASFLHVNKPKKTSSHSAPTLSVDKTQQAVTKKIVRGGLLPHVPLHVQKISFFLHIHFTVYIPMPKCN